MDGSEMYESVSGGGRASSMLVTSVSIGLVGRVLRKSPAEERRGEISSVVDWSMFDKPLPVF